MSCTRGCCPDNRTHFRSVSLATSGALTRVNDRESRLVRDMRSYKAMVDQGLEPCRLDGAYELERDATTVNQIEGRPDDIDL